MLVKLPAYPRAPAEITWKLKQPSQANRSEFTGYRRVTILPEAPRWTAQVKYPPIIGEDGVRPWRAALAAMQGRAGTFRLLVSEKAQAALFGGQMIMVDGAGQVGSTVNLRGWQQGQLMRAGWFVTINNRLHQVLEESLAGPDGKMALTVIPQVARYADGAAVEVGKPYALMSLADDEAGWQVSSGQRYEIGFNCEEAL